MWKKGLDCDMRRRQISYPIELFEACWPGSGTEKRLGKNMKCSLHLVRSEILLLSAVEAAILISAKRALAYS